jgi:capsular polysaccharide transport system permease protein
MNDIPKHQLFIEDLHGATATQTRRQRLKDWAYKYRGSLIFIALPSLITAIYFFLIASDLYASEASFVVRSPSHMQSMGGLSSLLQGAGISRAQDDDYAVNDFVVSRDAIDALDKQVNLREIFNRPGADFLARYPNIIFHDNAEDFFRYYQYRVDVVLDSMTGITTLTVEAFRPEDAQLIANLLLKESEALVNRMNERAHQNSVREAEAEVKVAEDGVIEAEQNLLAYRTRETMLDPNKSSGAILEMMAKMQAELAMTKTRLAELDSNSPGSPLHSDLEAHVTALQSQIESQRSHLAGGSESMAPKISEYQQLILKQEFAAKELASSMASLESARAEARRQSIYLDRVVEPNLSDKALFPKRIKSFLIVLISCFMAYSSGRLLIAGVREHAQE